MKSNVGFARRLNEDGTIDSICLCCFLTVATADARERLVESEERHQCADDHLLRARADAQGEYRGNVIKWPRNPARCHLV